MRVVYLRPGEFENPPPPFRCGEAGCVWLDAEGRVRSDTRVRLSANTTHALLGHGVVDALNALGPQGRIGEAREALLPHALLEAVQALFYAADCKTYGGVWEFCAGVRDAVEYRVRVHNREYQRSLSRLQFLVSTAREEGFALRVKI